MYSLVVPVYKNEEFVPKLCQVFSEMNQQLSGELEVIFVVDGSPDQSYLRLQEILPTQSFRTRLLLLSRNYGSFAAIVEGLKAGCGPYFAVMAADLQEPPELVLEFFRALKTDEADVVLGKREHRADPFFSRLASNLFWGLYRRLVQPQMPVGGVDVFGCNQMFRDRLIAFRESNSSLVGLLLWLGYRRKLVGYTRQLRLYGRSAWTLKKKMRYFSDSIFAFSDLPIRLLVSVGFFGLLLSIGLAFIVLLAKWTGNIAIPGYTATILVIVFFAALNSFGLGIIGSYVWRAFENTKARPNAIVMENTLFLGGSNVHETLRSSSGNL